MKSIFDSGASLANQGFRPVRAVERAVRVLSVLAEERRALGVGEVARLSSLPEPTAYRILNSLSAQGWVAQSQRTLQYRLAHGLLGVAAIALAHATLLERARPILARIARAANEPAYIAVLVGRRVAFLERGAPATDATEFHPGVTQPVHCTSAGKVLSAFLQEGVRRSLFPPKYELRKYTPATITDRRLLEKELDKVVELGYALDDGEFRQSWRSVAVPVRGDDGNVVAAISCGAVVTRMPPEHREFVREELLQAAEDLSRQLGFDESGIV